MFVAQNIFARQYYLKSRHLALVSNKEKLGMRTEVPVWCGYIRRPQSRLQSLPLLDASLCQLSVSSYCRLHPEFQYRHNLSYQLGVQYVLVQVHDCQIIL